jgi:hypothetical protein
MSWPWEQPALTLRDYVTFMDSHVRISVVIDGTPIGSFAVRDEGVNMNVDTVMPDGRPLMFKVEGHPRTTDPVMTSIELVNHVLANYS